MPNFLALLLLALLLTFASHLSHSQNTDSTLLDGHLERAELALEDNRYRDAAVEYLAAAKLSDEVEIAQTATRVAYTYEFSDLGIEAALRWLDLDEKSEEALLYVAQTYLRLGELRRAERYFERLIESGDSDPDERLLSLIPILSEEDESDAYRLMRRLVRRYDDSAYAQYAVAVLALQAGEAEVARDRAERAVELEPEWIKPKLLYARALMLAGEEDAAIDYAARVVGDDPQPDPEARLELAVMYLSAGRDDDALSQVNQVLLEQPARADALRMLAIINFRLENLDAAWADFQDLLASGRYTMDALFYLGRIADIRDENERAIGLYTQVTGGQNVVAAQRRASALIAEQGAEDAALDHLDQFGDRFPTYAVEMVVAKAQLLVSLERYEEALEAFDQVRRFRPDSEGIMLGRADLLIRMGRIDGALAQFEDAMDRFPDSANTLNALGYTLADKTDRYREAYRLIRKAIRLEPDNPAIIDSWGWVLYKLGRHEEALEELERAYRLFPDGEIAAHVVEVLWKLDRGEEALEFLQEAEAENPDHPLLNDVRKRAFPDTVEED
ncbi:MAG: tetratricopeptide repeat protein [Woeseiaceae bacterium]|nr:tetratricopeptide repeat protein [Woeseiaceae bacterium]